MEENIELTISGIKCDACDYRDDDVKFEDYPLWLNKPCPKCEANLLTVKDYDECLNLMGAAKVINAMSQDQLSAFVDAHELRRLTAGELMLMFSRLQIQVEENPEMFKKLGGVDYFFVQENYRRVLLTRKFDLDAEITALNTPERYVIPPSGVTPGRGNGYGGLEPHRGRYVYSEADIRALFEKANNPNNKTINKNQS